MVSPSHAPTGSQTCVGNNSVALPQTLSRDGELHVQPWPRAGQLPSELQDWILLFQQILLRITNYCNALRQGHCTAARVQYSAVAARVHCRLHGHFHSLQGQTEMATSTPTLQAQL